MCRHSSMKTPTSIDTHSAYVPWPRLPRRLMTTANTGSFAQASCRSYSTAREERQHPSAQRMPMLVVKAILAKQFRHAQCCDTTFTAFIPHKSACPWLTACRVRDLSDAVQRRPDSCALLVSHLSPRSGLIVKQLGRASIHWNRSLDTAALADGQ